jgi:hypothetical protein
MQATEQLKKWPEKGERKLVWISPEKAIDLIEEPGVIPLLRRVIELQDALANSRNARPDA